MARKQAVCGHESHHAKGLCRQCFDFFRKQAKTNIVPPNIADDLRAKVEAAGLLVPREDNRFKPLPETPSAAARQLAEEVRPSIKISDPVQPEPAFNTADPSVAQHIAGAVARSLHDFRAAAKLLRPDLSPGDQASLAYQLERDANVRAALQIELSKLGLTDEAKEKYFTLLWRDATDLRPEAERARSNAMRLLGKAFLPSENPSGKNEQPVPLPITNLEAGLERMGLGDDVMRTVPSGEFTDNLRTFQQEEDDADEEEG